MILTDFCREGCDSNGHFREGGDSDIDIYRQGEDSDKDICMEGGDS